MAAKMLVILAMAVLLNMAAGVKESVFNSTGSDLISDVREFLHVYGGPCKSTSWKVRVDPIAVRVPICDLTLVKRNCVFEGMTQTYIQDFSSDYDYENGVLILFLFYPKVRVRCDMDIYFHRPNNVPIKVPTRCDATYYSYTTTTLFGLKCGTDVIDIENRQTYPGLKTYSVSYGSPQLTEYIKTRPRVAQGVNCINANLKTVMTEIQVEKSKAFSTFFIRNRLVVVDNEKPWVAPLFS